MSVQIYREALPISEIAPSFSAKPVNGGKPLKERRRRRSTGAVLKDQKNTGFLLLRRSIADIVIMKYPQK